MKAFVLTALLLLAGKAHAEKSVWDQLKSGTVDPIHAQITHVELDGLEVTYKTDDGRMTTAKICSEDPAVNGNFYTEADRAMALNRRIQALLKARDEKRAIELGHYGPWNACVWPLEI